MIRHFAFAGAALFAGSLLLSTGCAAQNSGSASASAGPTTKPYMLSTCIVSDEKLGGPMGAPVVYVYKGQEVKFCCPNCEPEFKADPEKFMKKLQEASKTPATRPAGG
jgi:YHS domain-containing protein